MSTTIGALGHVPFPTVWRSATMTEMLAEARAGGFDLLLAGYSDRWQRNLRRTLELLEDGLHPAGVALVMCDRRILSSDPHDWDELISEAAGAEKYSRRLSERITDGYAAKFDHRDDPGGHAGLGFRRLAEPPHTLEIDPATIGVAVALFERYALGNLSAKDLAAETGLADSRIRMILMNPLYNGWVRRHRRSRSETRKPAPWRADPPVSDELWARVEDVRRTKTRAGGARRADRVDLLKGLLECVCGRRVRSDGTFADGRHRKLHVDPCADWGTRARLGDEVWEEPILAQVEGVELDDDTIGAVVASLGSGPRPVALDQARIERQIRELALEHAAGRLEDATYLERLHRAPGCQGQPRAHQRRWDLAGAGRGVAAGVVSNVEGGRGSRGEGRPAPRHLRSDYRRREENRVRQAHSVGIRPRIRARATRKGCTGAPDSV